MPKNGPEKLSGLERREVLLELVMQYSKADCDLKPFLMNEYNITEALKTQTRAFKNRRRIDCMRDDASADLLKPIFAAARAQARKKLDDRFIEALARSKLDFPSFYINNVLKQKSYPAVILIPTKRRQVTLSFEETQQAVEMQFLEVDSEDEIKVNAFFVWLLAAQFAIFQGDTYLFEALTANGTESFKKIAKELIKSNGKPTEAIVLEMHKLEEGLLLSNATYEETLLDTTMVHSLHGKHSHSTCERRVNSIGNSVPTAFPYEDFSSLANNAVLWHDTKHCIKCDKWEHFKLYFEIPMHGFFIEGPKSSMNINLALSLNAFFPVQVVLEKTKFYRSFSIVTELNRNLTPRKILFIVDNLNGGLLVVAAGQLKQFEQNPEAAGYAIKFVAYTAAKPPPQLLQPTSSDSPLSGSNIIMVEIQPIESVPHLPRPIQTKDLKIKGKVAAKHENCIPRWGNQTEPYACCWLNYLIQVIQYFARIGRLDICWLLYHKSRGHALKMFKSVCANSGKPSTKSEDLRRLAAQQYVDSGVNTNMCLRELMKTSTLKSAFKICDKNHKTSLRKPHQINLELELFQMVLGLRFPFRVLRCGWESCSEPTKLVVKVDPMVLVVEGTTHSGDDNKLYLYAENLFQDYPAQVRVAGHEYFLHFLCATEYYVFNEDDEPPSPHGFNFQVFQGQVIRRICDSEPLVWSEKHVTDKEVHGYGVAAAYYVMDQQPSPPPSAN